MELMIMAAANSSQKFRGNTISITPLPLIFSQTSPIQHHNTQQERTLANAVQALFHPVDPAEGGILGSHAAHSHGGKERQDEKDHDGLFAQLRRQHGQHGNHGTKTQHHHRDKHHGSAKDRGHRHDGHLLPCQHHHHGHAAEQEADGLGGQEQSVQRLEVADAGAVEELPCGLQQACHENEDRAC